MELDAQEQKLLQRAQQPVNRRRCRWAKIGFALGAAGSTLLLVMALRSFLSSRQDEEAVHRLIGDGTSALFLLGLFFASFGYHQLEMKAGSLIRKMLAASADPEKDAPATSP